MTRIAIPKLRDDRPRVEYRVRFDPELNDELLQYQRLYVQTYGQEIEPKDLIEPIVRRFLGNDRTLRQFRKRKPREAPPPSVPRPSSNGTVRSVPPKPQTLAS